MSPQELLEVFGNAPEIQICFFQFLLAALATGAEAVVTGAKAVGGAITGGAVAGGNAITGGATAVSGAATGTPLSAFTDVATGSTGGPLTSTGQPLTLGPSATPTPGPGGAPISTPTPTPIPTSTFSPGGNTPPVAPVLGSTTPVAGTASPKSFPAATLAPPPSIGPAPPGLLASLKPTTTPPGLIERINKFVAENEKVQLVQNIRELGRQAPSAVGSSTAQAPQDQPIAPTERIQIPQLAKAQTVETSSTSLNLSRKEETPLTFEQIKGLQNTSIQELIALLRTQQRSF
jgi:hypothetical protein